MNNLAPVLQRELDQRVNTAARHAIAQEIDVYRRNIRWYREKGYGWGVEVSQRSISTLLELGRNRFERDHGRACLRCQARPTIRLSTGDDFCRPCAEMVEDSWQKRRW